MGRAIDQNRSQYRRRRVISNVAIVLLVSLLVFPILAIYRLAQILDSRFMAAYLAIVFSATYVIYRHDKKQAELGGWRTPESTLHAVELLGGWPVAFLAQRTLRHKISKISYQIVFWLIVTVHEVVSFDFVLGWPYATKVLALIRQ
jgi:uncharacterized membrane protein YsdA (DUF1294 family)